MRGPDRSPEGCRCRACGWLKRRYANDPDLLEFYKRKLLQRGWAGVADDVEQAYRLAHAPGAEGRSLRMTARRAAGKG